MSIAVPAPAPPAARAGGADGVVAVVLAAFFLLCCGLSLLILQVILSGSMPILRAIEPLRFLTDASWHPTMRSYGLAPIIAGSVLTSFGAIALALPVAIAIGAALHFFLPRVLAAPVRGFLFVVSATPTVIFGFWGLTEIVPLIGRLSPPGASLLAGIVMLALMILPTTAILVDVALAKVPRGILHGARALGASNGFVCFGVALPVVRAAVISAALLGLARALGETIVVVMVTGNRAEMPSGLLDPVRTLTANVALEMGYAQPLHASALFLSILLLFVVAAGLALAVHALGSRGPKVRVDV